MTLQVNGVNMIPYLAHRGFEYEEFDRGGEDDTPNMDGSLIWERDAVKSRMRLTCRALTAEELSLVLKTFAPGILTVVFTDPRENAIAGKTMICRSRPAHIFAAPRNGQEYWDGVSFSLEEK